MSTRITRDMLDDRKNALAHLLGCPLSIDTAYNQGHRLFTTDTKRHTHYTELTPNGRVSSRALYDLMGAMMTALQVAGQSKCCRCGRNTNQPTNDPCMDCQRDDRNASKDAELQAFRDQAARGEVPCVFCGQPSGVGSQICSACMSDVIDSDPGEPFDN